MLVAAIALVLGSTVTASDNARDWPYFEGPQQYLISNLGEVLREQHALESCSQQQQEALQRFLNMGISYNAAALMAHSQYPCDSTRLTNERAESHLAILAFCCRRVMLTTL
jgi:hypothetical protein